jgi:hypothetical protein
VPLRSCSRSGQRALCLTLLAVALLLALPIRAARAQGASAEPLSLGTPVYKRLSDLHTVSRWAYPAGTSIARSKPSASASAVGALKFFTGDGQAELYMALASAQFASGAIWIQIELPGRPNGQTGWVPQAALGPLHQVDGYLLVDRNTLRATLFRDGRAVFSAPVGVGKASTMTPAGHFYVMEKLRTVNAPIYGPLALGTSAYAPTLSEWPGGGVVGIHGTNEPQLIPGRPSHGCVRMRDSDIERLWPLIGVGTPIDII